VAQNAEQIAGGSSETDSKNRFGNFVTDRRTVFLGGAATGALAAVFGPTGARWLWEHTTWGDQDQPVQASRPNYLDLRFTPRPEFRQENAEVFHFAGDPAAADTSREERQKVAVIGMTAEQARRQFTDKGYTPVAVYWSGDMAHVAPLGTIENLGRLIVPQETGKPQGAQVEILAFGATIGEGDLHLSMGGLGENGALIPGRQLESAGILAAEVMADEQHKHVPVI
jgi:hypothetical protein